MTEKQYFVSVHKNKKGFDGSIKPRNDIANSLKGFIKVDVPYTEHVESIDSIIDLLSTSNPVLFLQYPLYNTGLDVLREIERRVKNIKIIGIIHDIDSVRFYGLPFTSDSPEMKDFVLMDSMYVSSEKVKQDIIKAGYKGTILVHGPWVNHTIVQDEGLKLGNVVYAGNLNKEKAGFLLSDKYQDIVNNNLVVYGNYQDDMSEIGKLRSYIGKTTDNFLVYASNMFNFGLVWDEGIDGNTTWSEYNSVNMPAKLSLYLRMGIPVIARKNTRASEIIEKYNLGLTINNLKEIKEIDKKYNQDTELWWQLKESVVKAQHMVQMGQSFTKLS